MKHPTSLRRRSGLCCLRAAGLLGGGGGSSWRGGPANACACSHTQSRGRTSVEGAGVGEAQITHLKGREKGAIRGPLGDVHRRRGAPTAASTSWYMYSG